MALVQERMRQRGVTFKQAINDAIRAGLTRPQAHVPFQTNAVDLGLPAVNLDRALQVAAELEDEELVRKLRVGK